MGTDLNFRYVKIEVCPRFSRFSEVDLEVVDVLKSPKRVLADRILVTPTLLRIRSDTQHGNVRASVLQYLALRRRLWGYGILSARRMC